MSRSSLLTDQLSGFKHNVVVFQNVIAILGGKHKMILSLEKPYGYRIDIPSL